MQYSLKKNRVLLGFIGEQSEQQIISELDSALNQWVDSVPDHRKFRVLLLLINSIFFPLVRWDPHREHPQFFEQSALIYANYYYVQILIHRSFIPTPNKPSSTSFPSLAICTNAARSCSHILDAQMKRGLGLMPHLQVRRNLYPLMTFCSYLTAAPCIHSCHRPSAEHLGRDKVRCGYRPGKGDGGCRPMYECA